MSRPLVYTFVALVVVVLVAAAIALVVTHRSSSSDKGNELVWCVAPGEKVTPRFKREYPELHMTKAACDAVPNS